MKKPSLQIIENMIEDLNAHHRNKESLLEFYVSERINKQIQSYYKQILDSCTILQHQQNEVKVVKKLSQDV